MFDVLVGVRAGFIMYMFVKVEVVVIEVRLNVVVDSLIDVVTNKLADVFIEGCAGTPVALGVCDMGIIVVAATAISFECTVPVSCSVDVLADMIVVVLVDVLTGVLAGVMICIVVVGIGVDALAVVNVSVLTAV